jgi:hypothetical protein
VLNAIQRAISQIPKPSKYAKKRSACGIRTRGLRLERDGINIANYSIYNDLAFIKNHLAPILAPKKQENVMRVLITILALSFISASIFAQYDKKSTVMSAELTRDNYDIVIIPFEKCRDSVVVEITSETADLDSVFYCYTNHDDFTDWGLHSFKVEGNQLKFTVREFRPFDALAVQFINKLPGAVRIEYRRF